MHYTVRSKHQTYPHVCTYTDMKIFWFVFCPSVLNFSSINQRLYLIFPIFSKKKTLIPIMKKDRQKNKFPFDKYPSMNNNTTPACHPHAEGNILLTPRNQRLYAWLLSQSIRCFFHYRRASTRRTTIRIYRFRLRF